jgi:hypothetical protein
MSKALHILAHHQNVVIPSPHLLVLATSERRVPTRLSLAKIALKMPLAGRNRSLVANTSRCGEDIKWQLMLKYMRTPPTHYFLESSGRGRAYLWRPTLRYKDSQLHTSEPQTHRNSCGWFRSLPPELPFWISREHPFRWRVMSCNNKVAF